MIVIDSGPLIAALNIRDRYHEACARLLQTHPEPLLVPATVVTEVCQLVEKRQGSKAEAAFLRSFGSGLTLVELADRDLQRMSTLVETYASLPLGAVDASVVAVAERLDITEVATLDRRHFTVVRPRHTGAFMLLPERL
ncbi:type II toxin-antitoxin system VapC family toxin [Microbispora sp. H10670]|uniref:type II toxin-antitoxin system VapC family toxin n=1 Tax=Microbispora sp. H10670 TaxID=2729108 RepID=UPI0016004749|nr:PIN domain-containing protein [Microbispora sp. H10670]